jgi:hypothetical protein
MTDVGWMDATAQAALMREGKASPLELLDVALARLDAVNPQLNAVIHLLADRAQLVLTRSVRDTAGVLGLVEQGQLITRAVDGWFALTGQPAISLPIHWRTTVYLWASSSWRSPMGCSYVPVIGGGGAPGARVSHPTRP